MKVAILRIQKTELEEQLIEGMREEIEEIGNRSDSEVDGTELKMEVNVRRRKTLIKF